tara:strand:+ start:350 stop:580 length:231 start_codon:yes stop_codon:yes gene_type:complete
MYKIVFNFKKDLDKSIMVQKKTKKINKIFFIPKSIILEQKVYTQEKNLWKDVKYEVHRIELSLPKWYCKKELGFYK